MSRVADLVWDVTIKVPVPQPGDKEYVPGTGSAYVRADRWVRSAVTLDAIDAWIKKGLRAANRGDEAGEIVVLGFKYDASSLVYLGAEGHAARMRFSLSAAVDGGNPVPFVVVLVALAIIAGTVVLDVVVEEVSGKGVFERVFGGIGKGLGDATKPALSALAWVVFGVVLLVLALGGALTAGPVKVSRLAKGRR